MFERLHHRWLESGEVVRAARAAFWIGFRLLGFGEIARATGWLARSERLVETHGDPCVERGYLLLPLAHRHFSSGNLDAAYATAGSAAEIGDRFGDRDLAAFARTIQGRTLVRQGRLNDGLALLDEVMVSATSDELSTIFTGLIYCGVIDVCRSVYAIERAHEWTRVLTEWCDSQPQLVPFTGACLVHRAEILQLHGQWTEAIAEAERATERFDTAEEPIGAGEAFYQRAEIHRLRGEFSAAEEAYREASRLGRQPQPGLSLLRLVQGKNEVAAQGVRGALESANDALKRARFLPAHWEIALAIGEVEEARRTSAELTETASRFDAEVLGAMAAHARGAMCLADRDPRGALAPLRDAFEVWQRVGAPYLAARVRVLLAEACQAAGDHEGAALERDAARTVFTELGAAPDLARLEALAHPTRGERPHGLTPRELEVLRLVAAGGTNKAIAKQLFVSEKTIDRHVSNIFSKLNVPSRAAATAYAYEHELL